ncbi:hypothetical protein FB45DRAFT_864624 [Roridomyces roridus]|uniref:Uncharacterized protein n=1 Tax=Roridomyces roridus TaxID=1738132 RepID=A0AAD7C1I9_9AGAR|nr:hypothetical protein FB45DRAFT_864624 [Roridomyces roridus]
MLQWSLVLQSFNLCNENFKLLFNQIEFNLQSKPLTTRASAQEKLTKFEMSTGSTLNFVGCRAGCTPACGGGLRLKQDSRGQRKSLARENMNQIILPSLPRWRWRWRYVVAVEDGNLCQAGASREQGVRKGFTSLWHSWESLSAKNLLLRAIAYARQSESMGATSGITDGEGREHNGRASEGTSAENALGYVALVVLRSPGSWVAKYPSTRLLVATCQRPVALSSLSYQRD